MYPNHFNNPVKTAFFKDLTYMLLQTFDPSLIIIKLYFPICYAQT